MLWPAVLLAAAFLVKASKMGAPKSTYICPISSNATIGVPFMQILSVFLDCYVIISLSGLASAAKLDTSPNSYDPSVVMGSIFLVIS